LDLSHLFELWILTFGFDTLYGMSYITDFISNPYTILTFKFLYYTAPVWVTFILGVLAWDMWLTYKRSEFIAKQEYVLLEVKLPKEITKSPLAMEFFFNSLHQPFGEDKLKIRWWPFQVKNDYYWKGSVRPWFSLEICAIDGKIHFFIWGRKASKGAIEAQLYSQFAGIEIHQVPDYTLPLFFDPEKVGLWGTEFELTKADPYPIKTYIDYGMDKDPKEEYKIDPLTPLIEFLGSLPSQHQVWIQIVITAHKATYYDKVAGKVIDKVWAKAAEEEIKKIHEKAKPPKPKEGEQPISTPRTLTEGEKDTISALERSVSKRGFDTGIRIIYSAPKDTFSMANVGGIMSGLTHFNSSTLNGFKPAVLIDFDWKKTRILNAYKNRGFFWNEYKRKTFVLNTEELATIFHFPSSDGLASSPAFERITSKKSEAPSNLPQ
jgi:hypothetical protein